MKTIITFIALFFTCNFVIAQQVVDSTYIWGVTIDNVSSLSDITTSLSNHCKKTTARIVFDAGEPTSYYTSAINAIHNVSFIMGELVDSFYDSLYTVPGFINQTTSFLNAFENKVDIWEIGNEVNGTWNLSADTVAAQIHGAYNVVKTRGKKTALTFHYDDPCNSDSASMMFPWIAAHVTDSMKMGLDYVLVSYYEQDCNDFYPANWQQIFDSLHTLFPNSKVGFGECGVNADVDQGPHTDVAGKGAYMRRYYDNLNHQITTPGYIGGYFWWDYREDCVSSTEPLWDSLNSNFGCSAITNVLVLNQANSDIIIKTVPNPSSGHFTLQSTIPESEIIIYTITGQKIYSLKTNTTNTEIDMSKQANGIYFIQIKTEKGITTKKINVLHEGI